MQELSIFKFEGDQVRTVIREGEPWFVAKDVAEILGFKDAYYLLRTLDEDEISKDPHIVGVTTNNRHGAMDRETELSLINESGLYHAIFTSRKKAARDFRRWVTSEVLPSIRKTGAYHADRWYAAIDVYNAGKKVLGKRPGTEVSMSFHQALISASRQPGMAEAIKGNNGEWFIRESMTAAIFFACSTVKDQGQLVSLGKGDEVLRQVREKSWITGKKADDLVEVSVGKVWRQPDTLCLA